MSNWQCDDCKAENPPPSLDDIIYSDDDHCRSCGCGYAFDLADVAAIVKGLIERIEELEAMMKCCNTDLGKGEPFVVRRYWCDKCKTEHLVDAKEMTEYVEQVHREAANAGQQGLPNIL